MGRIVEILAESLDASEVRALEALNAGGTARSIDETRADILVSLKLASRDTAKQSTDAVSITSLGQRVLYDKLSHSPATLAWSRDSSDAQTVPLYKLTATDHVVERGYFS